MIIVEPCLLCWQQVDLDRDDKNKRLINQEGHGKGYCVPSSRQRRRSSSLANNNNFNSSNNNSLANSPVGPPPGNSGVGVVGRGDAPTRSASETKTADSNYISVSGSMSWGSPTVCKKPKQILRLKLLKFRWRSCTGTPCVPVSRPASAGRTKPWRRPWARLDLNSVRVVGRAKVAHKIGLFGHVWIGS